MCVYAGGVADVVECGLSFDSRCVCVWIVSLRSGCVGCCAFLSDLCEVVSVGLLVVR